jgi:hypothetical protein
MADPVARMPPAPSKWCLITIKGDETDKSRVYAYNFNRQMCVAMEPAVQAAFPDGPEVSNLFMLNAWREMHSKNALQLLEHHLASARHEDANQELPGCDEAFNHMRDLLAGVQYQSRVKERLYARPQYDQSTSKPLADYLSDLIVDSRDAGIFGRELAELLLSKCGDARRVHIQSIFDKPNVNYDAGKLLVQLQLESPSKLKYCASMGTTTVMTRKIAGLPRVPHRSAQTARIVPNHM